MNYKILVVDDEPVNLRLMERLFRRTYDVVTAPSGKEALKLLQEHDIALIISDQRMPEMTGIEFLKCAAEMRQHTVRIILTGYTDISALVEAVNSGVVYKYVSKPWLNEDLLQSVKRGLEIYESNKRLHRLTSSNERLSVGLKAAQDAFVRLALSALGARDQNALTRARRVSEYAVAIGSNLSWFNEDEIAQLSLAAQLHGIGQVGVPDHILKNSDASVEERLAYLEHTEKILSDFPEMNEIALAVRHYRENFDGSGYPAGLDGQRIPLFSRIIAVAAAYAEMTDDRSLFEGERYLHEAAIDKLSEESGKRFDPIIVDAFLQTEIVQKTPQLSVV